MCVLVGTLLLMAAPLSLAKDVFFVVLKNQ